jgi:hypothetical protein
MGRKIGGTICANANFVSSLVYSIRTGTRYQVQCMQSTGKYSSLQLILTGRR